jgi:hypothetical protein
VHTHRYFVNTIFLTIILLGADILCQVSPSLNLPPWFVDSFDDF